MNAQTESQTNDRTHPQECALITDTGATGRPRRNRYSKAAMLQDIVSIADPRMWPTYVAAALVLAIPLYALFSPGSDDAALARRAAEPPPAVAPEPAAEEPGPLIVGTGRSAAPSPDDRANARAQHPVMLVPGDQYVLVARHEHVPSKRPARRHLPVNE